MEMIKRRIVGDVVWMEVVVVKQVLLLLQPILLLGLWSSSAAQTWSLRLDLIGHLGRVDSSWGRVAAAGRRFNSLQDVWLRHAVPDGLIRRVQVFLVGGPGLTAGGGLQGVCTAGWGF